MNDEATGKSSGSATAADGRVETRLVGVMAVLVVGSFLLWSSPEYRADSWLLAGVAAAFHARLRLLPLLPGTGWQGVLVAAGLIVAQGASWLGGLLHGESLLVACGRGLAGMLGVAGLAVFTALLLEPRWKVPTKRTGLGILALLLAGSYAGFFIGIERFFDLGRYEFQFDQLRMALICPTRLLTWSLGQIPWEHTNYAAYYFALALALVLEHLGKGGKGRGWWCLCLVLGVAVFLTASRNGWLMIGIALPLVLAGRKPAFALKVLALFAGVVLLGFGCLKTRLALVPPAGEGAAVVLGTHGSDLLERGSAGRLIIYKIVWQEVSPTPLFGQGLQAVGREAGFLEHEHSIFIATLRGGGLVGLAGHLLVIAGAACSAVALLRRGIRWPAVLLFTAVGGLCFERSSVFLLSGQIEFITHWVAVSVPLIISGKMAARSSA